MAGGEAGADRAIEILSGQVSRTMRLLGVTCLEELAPRHVTQLFRARTGRVVTPAYFHSCNSIPRGHSGNRRRVRAVSETLANRDVGAPQNVPATLVRA